MNRVILLGPPGAGKGTQAERIVKKLGVPQISTGQILRDAINNKTELGLKVKSIIDKGDLVSDDIIIDIVKERLSQPDCQNGYLLDGYPRTIAQAEALNINNIKIDSVIVLLVDYESIVSRISGRWVHKPSGRTYHELVNPPKHEGLDDITGEKLIQREDDKPETVRDRLKVYDNQTQPLVAYYKKLSQTKSEDLKYLVIDGNKSIDMVSEDILSNL